MSERKEHMPINKNSLRRYRIEDKLLSDPNYDYTTESILKIVNAEMSDDDKVTLRMIQKDILALQDDFEKEMERGHGGRGTVRYKDQSSPLFYQELTEDEEILLREVLSTLGQFEGLDNFTWLDLLKKKLDMGEMHENTPILCFSKNDRLQIPASLLGHLFTAISRKKVISFTYSKFSSDKPREYMVYPYQLKQYNDRWYLLCSMVGNKKIPFTPDFIATFALDRMNDDVRYVDNEPYVETRVDLSARFEEIIGVTFLSDKPVEDIYFAVKPETVPYVDTKWLHTTQIPLDGESEAKFKNKYPSLSDCRFFSIECRPNDELFNLFASYAGRITLVEPKEMRDELARRMTVAADNYRKLE